MFESFNIVKKYFYLKVWRTIEGSASFRLMSISFLISPAFLRNIYNGYSLTFFNTSLWFYFSFYGKNEFGYLEECIHVIVNIKEFNTNCPRWTEHAELTWISSCVRTERAWRAMYRTLLSATWLLIRQC